MHSARMITMGEETAKMLPKDQAGVQTHFYSNSILKTEEKNQKHNKE